MSSTTSAAEEAEELRARAMASMPSSAAANNSSGPKSQTQKNREEGEITPDEDAAAVSELPAYSAALPSLSVDHHAQGKSDCPGVKTLTSSCQSMTTAQIRSSFVQNDGKHSKRMQVPLKPTNNQIPSWHGKGSDDNLVISFSDDESGSNSEESKLEKTMSMKENFVKLDKSQVPIAPLKELPGGSNRSRHVQKMVNPSYVPPDTRAHLPSSRHLATSTVKDSLISRHNSNTRVFRRQEHNNVPHPDTAVHRLASLRHEIALRENQLKVQKNASSYTDNHVPHSTLLVTKAAGMKRSASVTGIGVAPKEQIMKRLKPAMGSNGKQHCSGQVQLPVSSSKYAEEHSSQLVISRDRLVKGEMFQSLNVNNEKQQNATVSATPMPHGDSLKEKIGGSLASISATMSRTPVDASKHGNNCISVADIPQSNDKSEKRNMALNSSIAGKQISCLPQSDTGIEGILRGRDSTHQRNLGEEPVRNLEVQRQVDFSNLLPTKAPGDHSTLRIQQTQATLDVLKPRETSSNVSTERHSGQVPESKSGNDEGFLQNSRLLNYSSQVNISVEANVNLQSWMELEDLLDKELEEAQEHRRMCELEERRALKAYRNAQRALIDANEKCSLLYQKRELFSGELRALLMQVSNSMWPSGWESHIGTIPTSVGPIRDTSFDQISSLAHRISLEGQNLSQLGYMSNSRHSNDVQAGKSGPQLNGHDSVIGQSSEQDASTSEHIDNSALDGVLTHGHQLNLYTDEEGNYPFDQRPGEFDMACTVQNENNGKVTSYTNEPERLSSEENVQNYELLEASLRSKLVKRLGGRISYKNNMADEAKCLGPEEPAKSDSTVKSPVPEQQMLEEIMTEMPDQEVEGAKMLRRSTDKIVADSQIDSGFFSADEALRMKDSQYDGFLDTEPCGLSQATSYAFPSAVLHVTSTHATSITPLSCFAQLSTGREEATCRKKSTEYMGVGVDATPCGLEFTATGEPELYSYDLSIDPFQPFCMYELRGKCNNEECQWQHVKNCSARNSTCAEHFVTACSDSKGSHLLSYGNSCNTFGPPYGLSHCILSIPTYYIGSILIKADSYLSRSLLARSSWQYWQRGFSASFSLPFSVQRILPSDAPFLQTGDGPGADDCSWNRLALYYQTLDCSVKQSVRGLPESEQCLEMALDLCDGNICKPNRKKALCMLSRAIEADPSSVVLWLVYLHIYYGKEKNIGKDDMFFHAVQSNGSSYELWIMYINSRMTLGDRLNAYEYALATICHNGDDVGKEKNTSACILDIFLQMIDFLCMSGNIEKANQRVSGLLGNSSDTLLVDINSCLTVSDGCIFWFCCVYLVIYKKLPDLIIQQFELEKKLPFDIEWPSEHLTNDAKKIALDLMKLAVDKMTLDIDSNPHKKDETSLRPLHFLAVSHVRCLAALEGLCSSYPLLASYLNSYPTCIELVLMSARVKDKFIEDIGLRSFEESLSSWPKDKPGIQCLWNQYVECALADNRVDLAKTFLARWFEDSCRSTNIQELNMEGRGISCDSLDLSSHLCINGCFTCAKQDDLFWFLNLSLYKLLQKHIPEAHSAIGKAVKVASAEDYKHCVREHAAFTFAGATESKRSRPLVLLSSLLNGYLQDPRSSTNMEPLSRKYTRYIKRPRVRQLINNILGPVSRDFSFLNSVLEVCFGRSLLPEKVDDLKGFVDFIESIMEMTPANYRLALSVYKWTLNESSNPIKFWACSLLINSIFQAVPVAPEHVWLEAADALRNSEISDISLRFHQHAVSVYPFSIKLWESYLDICRNTNNANAVVVSARERGIQLCYPAG